jgi:hypothetical protein
MSYDFEVVCSDEPKGAPLEDARKALPNIATLDGPFQVEPDDVAEAALVYVLAPKYLLQISVPAARTERDLTRARSAGTKLALAFRGALYDPQEGTVIWPRGKPKRYVRPTGEERIRLVKLEWFCPSSVAEGGAERFLGTLRRFCPEAVPTRFGFYEPMQGRLDPGDDSPFIAAWSEARVTEHGDWFFWDACSPCFGGSVSFPDRRETLARESGEVVQVHPPGSGRAMRLRADFDGRALQSDARWCETVVRLFIALAQEMPAFYGAGYVERDWVVRGRRLYGADGSTESLFLQRSRWWCGLPPKPTWLSWFGGPYVSLIADALPGAERVNDGLFLRAGPEPMDADELAGRMPPIPQELLAIERWEDELHGSIAHSVLMVEPAAYVPDV